MKVLAIDPGTTESAYVVWDGETILSKGKVENSLMLGIVITTNVNKVFIERI